MSLEAALKLRADAGDEKAADLLKRIQKSGDITKATEEALSVLCETGLEYCNCPACQALKAIWKAFGRAS